MSAHPQKTTPSKGKRQNKPAFTLLAAALMLVAGCGPDGSGGPQTAAPRTSPTPFPPPAASRAGESWLHPIDEMTLVFVPAGPFLMGVDPSDPDADPPETPMRTVHLSAFWIDQTEVTNGMYALCVLEGGCSPPNLDRSLTRADYYTNLAFAEHPAVNISWHQAADYCTWAGRRLPTEAEWEKAARGEEGQTYPWGEATPDCALLVFGNPGPGRAACSPDTARTGSLAAGASPYGALDMAGNVWEWTADWFAPDAYSSLPDQDPTGPAEGEGRVLRGGAFNDGPASVRTANRHQTAPENPSYLVGFRCALSAAP